jgi:hypothetical protein
MNLLKRTSTKLWQHQINPAMPPRPAQRQFAESMGVTFREPTKISGTLLLPGRYVFRRQDGGTDRNVVQIFKEDSTELVASLTAVLDP